MNLELFRAQIAGPTFPGGGSGSDANTKPSISASFFFGGVLVFRVIKDEFDPVFRILWIRT